MDQKKSAGDPELPGSVEWFRNNTDKLAIALTHVNEFWRFQAELRPKHFNYFLLDGVPELETC
jgi:hypothetical protein